MFASSRETRCIVSTSLANSPSQIGRIARFRAVLRHTPELKILARSLEFSGVLDSLMGFDKSQHTVHPTVVNVVHLAKASSNVIFPHITVSSTASAEVVKNVRHWETSRVSPEIHSYSLLVCRSLRSVPLFHSIVPFVILPFAFSFLSFSFVLALFALWIRVSIVVIFPSFLSSSFSPLIIPIAAIVPSSTLDLLHQPWALPWSQHHWGCRGIVVLHAVELHKLRGPPIGIDQDWCNAMNLAANESPTRPTSPILRKSNVADRWWSSRNSRWYWGNCPLICCWK